MHKIPSYKHVFVIGAQKAGTTWLQHTFDIDPKFYLPQQQEVHFFDRRQNENIAKYIELYNECNEKQISVDVTPAYLSVRGVIEKIQKNIDIFSAYPKFVVLLREPVARAFAAYQMYLNKGRRYDNFFDALNNDPEITEKSLYGKHIERWLNIFPKQDFKFVFFDEILSDPEHVYTEISNFLDLPDAISDYYKGIPINSGGIDKSTIIPAMKRKGGRLLRNFGLNSAVHVLKKSNMIRMLEKKNQKKLTLDSQTWSIAKKIFLEDIDKLDKLIDLGSIKIQWDYDS